jgi:hypothetical protein
MCTASDATEYHERIIRLKPNVEDRNITLYGSYVCSFCSRKRRYSSHYDTFEDSHFDNFVLKFIILTN